MTTKHAPATPLPWEVYSRTALPKRTAIMQCGTVFAEIHGPDYRRDSADCAYIAHAANAYPQLVEALRNMTHGFRVTGGPSGSTEHAAFVGAEYLLRSLGEDA